MKKNSVALYFISCLVGLVLLIVYALNAQAAEIEVHPGESIQEAIDVANPEDTIRVLEGTYYENIVVSKTLKLIGSGKDYTFIDGGNHDHVVNITADNCEFTGFTVRNSGYNRCGLRLTLSTNNTLIGNEINNNYLNLYVAGNAKEHFDHTIEVVSI